jgi:hypothetical protein
MAQWPLSWAPPGPASDAADSGLRLGTRPLNHTADCITIFHIQVAIKSLSVKLRMAGIQATVSPMALLPKTSS